MSYTDLEDGPHTFTVSMTDLAGTTGSASFAWQVDAVADLDSYDPVEPSVARAEPAES